MVLPFVGISLGRFLGLGDLAFRDSMGLHRGQVPYISDEDFENPKVPRAVGGKGLNMPMWKCCKCQIHLPIRRCRVAAPKNRRHQLRKESVSQSLRIWYYYLTMETTYE